MINRVERRTGVVVFHLLVYAFYTLLVFLAYGFALKLFFIQDDFGFITRHLPGGEVQWKDTWRPEGIYYRPFTQHIWYFIVNPLFHRNPFPYHLTNLIVHTINIILVYHIGRSLTRNLHFGLFMGLIYATRTLAYQALVWPSAVNELLVTCFLFATFLSYQRYVATGSRAAWWGSILLYLMAVLSKENSPTLLILLFIYNAWIFLPGRLDAKRLRHILTSLWPHILMVIALAAVKFTQFSAIQRSDYRMAISKMTIKTYLKFFLSFMNPPQSSYGTWRELFFDKAELLLVIAAIAAVCTIALWFLALGYKRRLKSLQLGRPAALWEIGSVRLFVFGCAWWVISFSVTAAMPQHAFQYYGLYPGLGMSLAVGTVFFDILLSLAVFRKTRSLGYILGFIISAFLMANYFTCVAGISKRDQFATFYLASEAKRIEEALLRDVPAPPKGAHFIVLEGPDDFRWVTSSGDQLKMLYGDMSIKVSFPHMESAAIIQARGKPDYYIKFTPGGSVVAKKEHTIEIGKYD